MVLSNIPPRIKKGNGRRRDHATRAYPAAQALTHPQCFFDHLPRSGQNRPDRCAQPLIQTDRDRVEVLREVSRLTLKRDRSIEQPRAIQVAPNTGFSGMRDNLAGVVAWEWSAATAVMRVLENENTSCRLQLVAAFEKCEPVLDLRNRATRQGLRQKARECSRATSFGCYHVCELLRQQDFAWVPQQQERGLVRHRAGREKKSVFLAEQRSGAPFKLSLGRVFAQAKRARPARSRVHGLEGRFSRLRE